MKILQNKRLVPNICQGCGTLTTWSFNSETMVSKKISYFGSIKTSSRGLIDDNELDRILENTNLDEFEPLVIGSP